jgi:serine/threonine protein kinase
MPTCPECHSFLLAPGKCPRDKKPLLDDTEAKKRGIIGKIADRYHVQTLLGEGGMGSVYLATHEQLQRKVAIKILRREGQMEEQAIARFKREAKATSLINHRHVISVLDFGELPDHSAFYVMEHLEGKSLADAVDKEAPFSLSRALSICVQVTKGLKAAHDKGVVHRDLKPDNIFLVANQEIPDFVKVLDFGVAKIVSDSQQLTKDGMLLGTPDYMAPEQAIGMPTDHRVDIYALGVMLYEMITGELPFTGQSFMEVLSQHIHNAPPLISQRHPEIKVPGGVDDFIQKSLKKRPENRYQNMQEVLDALFAISNIQEMLPNSVQMSMVGMQAVAPASKKMTSIPSRRIDALPNPSRKMSPVPEGGSRRVAALPQSAPSREDNTYVAQAPKSVPSGAYQIPGNKGNGQVSHSASFSTLPKNVARPTGSAAYNSPKSAPSRRPNQAPSVNPDLESTHAYIENDNRASGAFQGTTEFVPGAKVRPTNPPKAEAPIPNIFDSIEDTNLLKDFEERTSEWSSQEKDFEDDATRAGIVAKPNLPAPTRPQPTAPRPKPATVPPAPLPPDPVVAAPRPKPATVPPVALPPDPAAAPKIGVELMSVPLAVAPTASTPEPSRWTIPLVAIASFLVVSVILYFLVIHGSL